MGCCTLSGFVNTGLVLAGPILLEGVRTESHWIVGRGWITRPDEKVVLVTTMTSSRHVMLNKYSSCLNQLLKSYDDFPAKFAF